MYYRTATYSIAYETCIPLNSDPLEYFSSIHSAGGWYEQRQAEKSAQVEKPERMILLRRCELCHIGIGPGHVEQELYFYPVLASPDAPISVCCGNDTYIPVVHDWFFCCGDCARRATRCLPAENCLINDRHWKTMILLDGTDAPVPVRLQKQVISAIKKYIHAFITYMDTLKELQRITEESLLHFQETYQCPFCIGHTPTFHEPCLVVPHLAS